MLNFDISDTIAKLKATMNRGKRYIDSVSVNLPFGTTINFKPNTLESDVAKEIVIFLSDRRVLNSQECCDDCVENALKSIGEIRSFLVQKQLDLKKDMDSVLYMLIEIMLTEIKQFQTYVQKLGPCAQTAHLERAEQNYYSALSCLRGELFALLSQVANIGRTRIRDNRMISNYPNITVIANSEYLVTYKSELYLEDQKANQP